MRRGYAAGITLLVAAAVVWPVFRSPPRDSYPLSTYPMFSEPIEAVTDIDVAVGLSADGGRHKLTPELVGGTDEVIQAVATVGNAVRAGPRAAFDLCRDIAVRVADRGPLVVVEVLVATDLYDTIGYFRGHRDPMSTSVHASCEVNR